MNYQQVCLLEDKNNLGNILALKKGILTKLGGFISDIGMNGKKIAYGEDTYIQVIMRKKGL